jgi:hypothetical protein
MIIHNDKKNIEITSLEEWEKHCPPANRNRQWKPKRSAMEMAKFWLDPERQSTFLAFMREKENNIVFEYAIPELANKFDDYKSPRKADLCLFGNQVDERIFISIEGKADESFGTYIKNIKTSDKSKSKQSARIIALCKRFGSDANFFNLRYQLTYWLAGSIEEAIRNDMKTVYLIVQTFESDATNETKIKKNEKDLNDFINFISKSNFDKVERNEIIGPINNDFTKNIDLYFGKYHIKL